MSMNTTRNRVYRDAGDGSVRRNLRDRKASDDDILEIRARARAGRTMPRIRSALSARGLSLSIRTIARIIHGESYRELPGALRERKRRLKVTDGEVVSMREARRARASYDELAVQYGLSRETVRQLCTGALRPHLPGAVKYLDARPRRSRKYSDEIVRHIRASAAPKGCCRGERWRCIAMRLGIPFQTVTQIIMGVTYKDVEP